MDENVVEFPILLKIWNFSLSHALFPMYLICIRKYLPLKYSFRPSTSFKSSHDVAILYTDVRG